MEKALLKLLQRSYDEELSAAEDKLLQKALTNDVALQAEKKKLDAMRRVLGEVDYSFDSVFSENVMARIEMEESIDQGNSFLYAFNRIALPGLAAAIILLLFTVFSSGTLSLESIMGIESIQTEYLSEFLLFNY
jgi:hypothetical protein